MLKAVQPLGIGPDGRGNADAVRLLRSIDDVP